MKLKMMRIEVKHVFGGVRKAVVQVSNQAWSEGFTPVEGKKIILSSGKNVGPRTVYLPLREEARDKHMQKPSIEYGGIGL